MNELIKPARKIAGTVVIPGDKSISHRAVMIGSIASGPSRIDGVLKCDDCDHTITAFREMGIDITVSGDRTVIDGKGLKGLSAPRGKIYVGESGTTMRLLAGILAGQDFEAVLAADESLSRRPMRRITEPLSMMGAGIQARDGEYPPITIKGGRLDPIDYKLPVPSAQVKSAVLLAGLYAKGVTSVEEIFRSRDHTERMLKYYGSKIKVKGLKVSVEGMKEMRGRDLDVPGDVSSASFFLAGAILLKGSKVRINKLGINPTRAGILDILKRMGAKMKVLNKKEIFEPVGDVIAESSRINGIVIGEGEIPLVIDELPIIFVLASLAKGRTVIRGAGELKVKETDRIRSMSENLNAMGAKVGMAGADIIIDGVESLKGASLRSFGDHRTCMSMTIAALAAEGESVMDDTACVNKSFPEFFGALDTLINI